MFYGHIFFQSISGLFGAVGQCGDHKFGKTLESRCLACSQAFGVLHLEQLLCICLYIFHGVCLAPTHLAAIGWFSMEIVCLDH